MSRIWLSTSLATLVAACCPPPPAVEAPAVSSPEVAAPAAETQPTAPTAEQVLADSDLPEALATPLANDKLGVTIHRLSNGMTVYLSTDREKPRFTAWIPVRAGSRHDPPNSTGLAHYLEHMLFKGTDDLGTVDFKKEQPHLAKIAKLYDDLRGAQTEEARGAILSQIDTETQASAKYAVPNEFDSLYATLGVQSVNAFTWVDQTVYICDVPSNRLEAWATVEAERFRDSVFRLFYPELEAVYEEKNRAMDDADRREQEAMYKALFPEHPYGTQTTLGLIDHLKNPAFNDMVAFYKRWYVPNNMAIVLAGDIDAETALPVLEKTFGKLEPKPLEKPVEGNLVGPKGRVQIDILADGGNEVSLGWRTVAINDPDEPALEVMDWLVSNRRAGLLDVELVLSQKLPRAGAGGSNYYEGGFWTISGTAREGQTHEEVEKLLLGVVDKLKAGEFTQADIDAVVLQAEMREMRELESNWARVAKMASAFLYHQPWSYAARRSERLRKVTKEDVLRVAHKYLGNDMVAVWRKTGKYSPPKLSKPKITPIDIDPSKTSAFATSIREMPAKQLEPEWLVEGQHYQRQKLPAGDLLTAKNTINELFSLSYRFDLGSRQQKLICLALDLMEKSGMDGTSAEELQRKMYRTGTSITTRCTPDEITLRVSGIDRNLEQSFELLDKWLHTAALDQTVLDKLVANRISRRADTVKEPRWIAAALSSYAQRGKDSPYLLAPSNAMLKRAKSKQLARLLARLPDYQHKTTYFGPRDPAAVAKIVALGKKHRKVRPPKPVTYRKTKGVHIFLTNKDVAQAKVSVLIPNKPLSNDDRPVAQLYGEYLGGGMGGLVFQEIREARGLAYSAHGGYWRGSRPKDQSGAVGNLGTQNDKTIDALTTLLGIMRNPPLQADRLAKAQEAIDQEYRVARVSPRSIVGWVTAWDELGLDSDPRPGYWAKHRTLDANALTAFAGSFAKHGVIISVMADKAGLDMKGLEKIGKVEIVDPKKLFSY